MRELTPELRALYELSRAATQEGAGVDELLDRMCGAVVETFGFERAAIFRLVEPDGLLEPLAARGIPLAELPRGVRLDDQGLLRRAYDTGEAVFVADVAEDDALATELVDEYDIRSALAVPLLAAGRCLGFVTADRGGTPFELEHGTLDVLTTVGAVGGAFLERALEASALRRLNDLARGFVALASHELRTPAAVVHGIAATLHLRGDVLTSEQRAELRRALYEQTDRLRLLVEQLLDLSRLESNAIEIRPRRFAVRRRVDQLLLMVAPERLSDVVVRIDSTLEAEADPVAFDRVVSNLITNAFRYGTPPVTVAAWRSERHFRLSVEDCGTGVSAAFVPHLFERFSRNEGSASVSGSGLGLSIAQSYANAHGGELVYRDASPHGACFELLLPLQTEAGQAVTAE